jgi:hypothetical protein
VSLDEIHFHRLVGLGSPLEEVVEEVEDVLERVAEDAADVGPAVDPGVRHLVQRDELEPHDAAGALLDGPGPDQGQDDGDTLALGLDGIEAPEGDRHRLRVGPLVGGPVRLQDGFGGCSAPDHRGGSRHPIRIERVDVPAGGQDPCPVAQEVPARLREDVLAVQGAHH